ncbi:MAG: hypothetical protein M5U13_11415 [Thermoanaerobaculia bacterium]|nr:hypothetical protein [Thermoanaerobaculia bacterium]
MTRPWPGRSKMRERSSMSRWTSGWSAAWQEMHCSALRSTMRPTSPPSLEWRICPCLSKTRTRSMSGTAAKRESWRRSSEASFSSIDWRVEAAMMSTIEAARRSTMRVRCWRWSWRFQIEAAARRARVPSESATASRNPRRRARGRRGAAGSGWTVDTMAIPS